MRFARAVGLVIGAALLAAAPARAQDIPVAIAGPLTGQLAALGEQFKRGAELFVADANAKGGVLGKKLQLIQSDDQCDPKEAVSVANQLVGKNVVLVVGHACSSCSIPASDVYAEEGVLMITPASTNPTLTDRGPKFANVFRTIGRDDQQGAFAGNWIAQHEAGKKVAILHDKGAYGKGLADQARATLNKAGVKEVMYDSVNAGDKDFTALVTRMKSAGVEVIYYGGYHPEAGLILRQAREQGLKARLIGGDGLNTSDFVAVAGPAADGTLYTFAPDARMLPEAKEVVERLRKQGFEPEGFTLYTYAAFQVFADAAQQAKSTKVEDLEKALHSATFHTVLGDLAFDSKGDVKDPKFAMYEWKNGKSAPLK
jgi:branched-chain amino acid transport system substrate-binding protein